METINYKFSGQILLMNNPQTVDPFNSYARQRKVLTSKKQKTDEDLLELRNIDVLSKLYWDDEIGVYIPTTWVTASIGQNSYALAKTKRADIRASVFPTEGHCKLFYEGHQRIKGMDDIAKDSRFVKTMLLKQGQVKVAKCAPVFKNWHFSGSIEFDPNMIDRRSLIQLMEHGAKFGGFGDFRPTYGRATFEEVGAAVAIAS